MSDKPNQTPLPQKRTSWISLPPVFKRDYKQFMDEAADWNALKAAAIKQYSGSKVDKETVDRLVTEIPANINKNCTFFIFHYIKLCGVAVVNTGEEDGYATIRYLLSDGSEAGVGYSLIEAAADFSHDAGLDGKICLIPDNDGLIPYYKKIGFKPIRTDPIGGGQIFGLTPREPLWQRVQNQWRLVANDAMATWR